MGIIKKIINWYFSKDALSYWCVLALDSVIVLHSFIIGYYCVFGGNGVIRNFWNHVTMILFCIIFYLLGFRIFHTYSNVIRYSSFHDLTKVFYATTLSTVCVTATRLLVLNNDTLHDFPSVRVILTSYCFITFGMYFWRVIVKVLYDNSARNQRVRRVFVYGDGDYAISIIKALRNRGDISYNVCGVIAPEKIKRRMYVAGIRVYNIGYSLIATMKAERINAVIVADQNIEAFRENDLLINGIIESGIHMYLMPKEQEIDSEENTQQLNEINVEDLLPRDKIEVDMDAIGNLLHGKKILITGAAGSIGSEMVRQCAVYEPSEMILIDQAETPMHDIRRMMATKYAKIKAETIVTSITNTTRMEKIFSEHRPDYVFHAAAYKHVPMMEDNPSEAIQNNVFGTRVIADMAVKYGTHKFVMISTDKAVNPTNVMGCSKRICEIYCQSLNAATHNNNSTIKQIDGKPAITQFVTTRFGNVLGSNGSVIPIFREQIAKGGPITVTHPDIIRFFMLIPEACKLVLEAGTFGKGGEIFIFDMGKPVRIADLAKRMISMSGAKNIQIKYTGLRDGEKLFEEVLSDAETTVPTQHSKIRIAKVREYPFEEALKNEERLYKASFSYDDFTVVKIMKEIVPEFKSRHSKYEELD